MTRRRLSAARIAPLWLVLAGCAGGTAAVRDEGQRGPSYSGDQLMNAGDFDGAVRAYEREASDSPVAREKLLNAKTRAAAMHAMFAIRAADNGDAGAAQSQLSRAESLAPTLPAVRSARETIDSRLSTSKNAASLREQARAIVSSDPEEAERLLAEAQAIAPDSSDSTTDISRLRREATLRGEADRSADRAAEAWAAGDRDRTVRELAGARFAGRAVGKAELLRRRIEQTLIDSAAKADESALRASLDFAQDAALAAPVVRTLRERLLNRLVASARDLLDTHRPATAALLELEAKRLSSDVKTPALEQVREATTTTLIVRPFEDTTGGRVDGPRLARAVRERIALDALGGGQPLRVLDDSPESRAAHADAIVLSGRILTARESDGRTGRENKNVRYQSSTRRRPNPDFDALLAKLDVATAEVRKANDEKNNAVTWMNSLRALGFQRGDGTHLADVEFQTKLAAAQARVDRADAALTRAKDAEFAIRQQSGATPRDIEEPVYSEHVLVVTTASRTSQITAHLDLDQNGTSLFSEDVTAAAVHKETISDGFAPAGLVADPDDTPDDAAMAAAAADRFAAMAAGSVRTAAGNAARRHLVDARDSERAGRRDAAAESYAMYLLSTPEVASPERADAARALAELLDIHVALRTGSPKEDAR